MYRFLIVIEKTDGNYSAYSPDLPGCIATGATREEAEQNMYKAIEMHVKGLIEDNLPVPKSSTFVKRACTFVMKCWASIKFLNSLASFISAPAQKTFSLPLMITAETSSSSSISSMSWLSSLMNSLFMALKLFGLFNVMIPILSSFSYVIVLNVIFSRPCQRLTQINTRPRLSPWSCFTREGCLLFACHSESCVQPDGGTV